MGSCSKARSWTCTQESGKRVALAEIEIKLLCQGHRGKSPPGEGRRRSRKIYDWPPRDTDPSASWRAARGPHMTSMHCLQGILGKDMKLTE